MIVKVVSTTDNKFEGTVFEIKNFSSEEIYKASGKDFDVQIVTYLSEDSVRLQSSNYTIELKIISNG